MPDTPRINGSVTSWADLSVKVADERIHGITEASYGPKRTATLTYGAGDRPRGMTRGRIEPGEPSMTMDLHAWKALRDRLKALAPDKKTYGRTEFTCFFQYSYDDTGEVFSDELRRCRVTGREMSPSEGSDAITVKVTMIFMELVEDGEATL